MPQNEFDVNKKEIEDTRSPSYSISRSQKLSVIVLAFFAFITIFMWLVQFKKNLNISGQSNVNDPTSIEQIFETEPQEQSESALRGKDTDGDGLNDWEELNTYKTSPYLEDSDSDGFNDKTEIDSDNDPNCPVGRDCYGGATENPNEVRDTILDASNNLESDVPDFVKEGPKTEEVNELEEIMFVDGDVSELRKMLIENGMDKAMLDQVSDEDLLSLFRETIEGN